MGAVELNDTITLLCIKWETGSTVIKPAQPDIIKRDAIVHAGCY